MRLLLCAALIAMPLAGAHGGAEETSLYIEAYDDEGFYFTIEGYEGRNPTIVLQPGVTYNITLVNRGTTPHNFRVHEAQGFGTPLVDPGERAVLEFTVPTSGFDAYWCDPHRSLGMEGAAVPSADALSEDTPGLGVLGVLAAMGAVMMNRRRG